jgi:hypothetical protein
VNLFPEEYAEARVDEDTLVAEFPQMFVPLLEPGLYGWWISDHSGAEDVLTPYMLVFEIKHEVVE